MTAYEMRISDWSSDVCSSDLNSPDGPNLLFRVPGGPWRRRLTVKLGRFAVDSRTRPGPARGPIRAATAVPSGAGSLLGHRIPRKRALPRGPYLTHERQAPYRHHLLLVRARSEEHTSELQSLM